MDIRNITADMDQFTGNVYLLEDEVLVDAGEGEAIVEAVSDTPLGTIVITHSHPDHISNLPALMDDHPDARVLAAEPDNLPVDAEPLRDTIELAGHDWQVLRTPGHKDDSVCLYQPEEKVLFSGDLIFPGGSFGRTDLAEGDREQLITSIEQIVELDVQELYAGHDEPTTEDVNTQVQTSLEAAKEREPKYDE